MFLRGLHVRMVMLLVLYLEVGPYHSDVDNHIKALAQ